MTKEAYDSGTTEPRYQELLREAELKKIKIVRIREIAYTVVAVVLTAAVIVIAFYMVPALNSWKRASDVTAATYQDQLPKINRIIDSVAAMGENGVEATVQAREATAILKNSVQKIDGEITPLFGNLNSSLVSLRRLEDTLNAQASQVGTTVTRQLQTNGDLLASNQREINKTITGTSDELIDQLKTLARLSRKVEVIVDESAVDFKDRLKELEHISSNLVVITDETATALKGVHGITDDLHRISRDAADKTHALLFPPRQHWARRYILRPIQHLGGTVYLLVKVANGLN